MNPSNKQSSSFWWGYLETICRVGGWRFFGERKGTQADWIPRQTAWDRWNPNSYPDFWTPGYWGVSMLKGIDSGKGLSDSWFSGFATAPAFIWEEELVPHLGSVLSV